MAADKPVGCTLADCTGVGCSALVAVVTLETVAVARHAIVSVVELKVSVVGQLEFDSAAMPIAVYPLEYRVD